MYLVISIPNTVFDPVDRLNDSNDQLLSILISAEKLSKKSKHSSKQVFYSRRSIDIG